VATLIYGTAWKKAETAHWVRTAIEHGFRAIDTACQPKHYDEAGVGAAVAASLGAGLSRAELRLQTKFTPVDGQDLATIPYDPKAPLEEQVTRSMAVSLHNLQTEYVDCLILHSPLGTEALTLEVWHAMETLVDQGAARQLGISNCYRLSELDALCASTRHKPAVVQNRFYADTGYDGEIRAFCREQGIEYQSFWTLTANPGILSHPAIAALASRHRRTPAQILFRYLTQVAVAPLTGTRSENHMRADLEIFEFELTRREREAVRSLFEG
jgi:diketogulonate reductase-like aldo/keto reductase